MSLTRANNPRVVVSHPARQAMAYQRPRAAERGGMDVTFLTGLYYRPDRFPYTLRRWLPAARRLRAEKLLNKRRIEGLSDRNVVSLLGPVLELVLRPLRLIRQWDAAHDYLASRWVLKQPNCEGLTILHGFQGSCLRFLRAGRAGRMIRLLEVTLPPLLVDQAQLDQWEVRRDEFPDADRLKTELQECDYVMAQSEFSVDALLKLGARPERILRIHSGVNTEYFRPRSGERLPGPLRVVFVGSICRRKGVHHLLDAWKQLGLEDAELLLVGNTLSSDASDILKAAGKTVRVLGHLSGRDFLETFQQTDFIVHPSLAEGGCVSIYEALSCGLPCVVSSHTNSAVRHEIEGLVIPPGDVDALKAAILRMARSPELRNEMAAAARKRAETLSLDCFATKLASLYRQLAEASLSQTPITSEF